MLLVLLLLLLLQLYYYYYTIVIITAKLPQYHLAVVDNWILKNCLHLMKKEARSPNHCADAAAQKNPGTSCTEIKPEIELHAVFFPKRYLDDNWNDMTLLDLLRKTFCQIYGTSLIYQ